MMKMMPKQVKGLIFQTTKTVENEEEIHDEMICGIDKGL